eukprot:UN23036
MNTKPKRSQSKPVQKQLNQTLMKNMIEFIVPKLSDLAKGKNMIKSYKNAVRKTINDKFGTKYDLDKLIKIYKLSMMKRGRAGIITNVHIIVEFSVLHELNIHPERKREPKEHQKPIEDKIDVCEWKEGGQLRVQKTFEVSVSGGQKAKLKPKQILVIDSISTLPGRIIRVQSLRATVQNNANKTVTISETNFKKVAYYEKGTLSVHAPAFVNR